MPGNRRYSPYGNVPYPSTLETHNGICRSPIASTAYEQACSNRCTGPALHVSRYTQLFRYRGIRADMDLDAGRNGSRLHARHQEAERPDIAVLGHHPGSAMSTDRHTSQVAYLDPRVRLSEPAMTAGFFRYTRSPYRLSPCS